MQRNTKGFTLIELMICVAILSIIVTLVASALNHKQGDDASFGNRSGQVVRDQPASTSKCENGYVTENGVAVKTSNGSLLKC